MRLGKWAPRTHTALRGEGRARRCLQMDQEDGTMWAGGPCPALLNAGKGATSFQFSRDL